MLKKDKAAQKAAVDEYFKHWDNKAAKDETPEIREVYLAISWFALRTNFTRRGKLNTLPSRDSKLAGTRMVYLLY